MKKSEERKKMKNNRKKVKVALFFILNRIMYMNSIYTFNRISGNVLDILE